MPRRTHPVRLAGICNVKVQTGRRLQNSNFELFASVFNFSRASGNRMKLFFANEISEKRV